MEFLKNAKRRRTFLNEIVYVGLNVGLAVTLMIVVRVTDLLWPAFLVGLLSMWRIFAVRPRFWLANIQANMVSVIVNFSYVILLYTANQTGTDSFEVLILQIMLVIANIAWLVWLKPKSKRNYVVMQAAVALVAGTTAVYVLSYGWYSSVVVAMMWIIGYVVARHVLHSYDDESHIVLLSSAWGLLIAQIGYLAYHWVIAYRLPIFNDLLLPQATIIIFCIGFLSFKIYDSYARHQKVRFNDIVLPLVFTIGIILMLLTIFNGVRPGV